MRSAILTLALVAAGGSALAETIVPVRAIRSGSIINSEDVTSIKQNVTGGFEIAAAVIGKEARVTLYPGRPIKRGMIGPPAVLERNQIVQMVFRTGRLSITAEGRALDRAGVGDLVRVMNMGSRQTVTGRVLENGTIEVGQ